jgi:site-specific DNA-methyltransferase (adenine-specific)
MTAQRIEQLAEGVTLYLGDCRDIAPSLVGIGTVVTDPPYGMNFRSNYRAVRHDGIANDDNADLLWFACAMPAWHSRYVFCRWDNLADVPKPKSVITWVKNNWSMGDLEREHARQTEIALFYPGPEHRFPRGRPNDVIIAPRTGNEHHPTEKPVQLMRAILEWTDGVVLDPFLGSGSTGIAAVDLGREFVGIELDPQHFDTACRRISRSLRQANLFIRQRELLAPPKQEALL